MIEFIISSFRFVSNLKYISVRSGEKAELSGDELSRTKLRDFRCVSVITYDFFGAQELKI